MNIPPLLRTAFLLLLSAVAVWAVVRTVADAYREKHKARTPGMEQPEIKP